jgi:hypothetical protein
MIEWESRRILVIKIFYSFNKGQKLNIRLAGLTDLRGLPLSEEIKILYE